MSKYIAPRFRKDQTNEEKNAKLSEMVRDASVTDFPVLGGGVHYVPKPKLEYAAKAVEWEQKRLDAEEKQRVDDYVKKIQEEKAKEEELMMEMMSRQFVKRSTEHHQITDEPPPSPPAPVDEWVVVERKPRKEKKEFNFDDDDDRIDFFEIGDHVSSRLRKNNKS